MVKRFNWQIDREQEYPYDGPKPARQVAYVFDTNKCIECQTCTVACKTCWTSGKGQETIFWNNVETKPYGGYPHEWDSRLMQKCGQAEWQGKKLHSITIFEKNGEGKPPAGHLPNERDYSAPNLGEDDLSEMIDQGAHLGDTHNGWMFYLARICNHCDHPACLAACPRKAIYKREEDGIVLVDQERCRGYQACVEACPYKKVFFNVINRASEKCSQILKTAKRGGISLCVESCIRKIRLHGFLSTQEEPREDNPLDYVWGNDSAQSLDANLALVGEHVLMDYPIKAAIRTRFEYPRHL